MSRRTSILSILVLMFALLPCAAGAQTPDEGKGVAADPEVKASAVEFVRSFVDRINQRDPAAYDMTVRGYWTRTTREGFVTYIASTAPLKIYGIGSVKTHASTGHVSVQISYRGFWTPFIYWTERWFLQPVDGGGYLVDHEQSLTPKAAGDLISGTAELTIAASGLTIDTTSFAGITLLILNATNVDSTQALTTGLYELPDGVTAEAAQEDLIGNYGAYPYIGPTPLAPGKSSPWAFLVQRGKHYLLQGFTLDQDLQNPQIIQGASFAVTLDNA